MKCGVFLAVHAVWYWSSILLWVLLGSLLWFSLLQWFHASRRTSKRLIRCLGLYPLLGSRKFFGLQTLMCLASPWFSELYRNFVELSQRFMASSENILGLMWVLLIAEEPLIAVTRLDRSPFLQWWGGDILKVLLHRRWIWPLIFQFLLILGSYSAVTGWACCSWAGCMIGFSLIFISS